MVGRRVGEREQVAEQEAAAVGELGVEQLRVGAELVGEGGPCRHHGAEVAAAHQLPAIFDERLGHRRPDPAEEHRDRGHEQQPIGPEFGREADALGATRKQCRRREHVLETARDELAVAEHVGAALEHGDLAIAARQRDEMRLGHDLRLDDGTPREALVAEAEADRLGERGGVVVVKDQFAHGRRWYTRRASGGPHE